MKLEHLGADLSPRLREDHASGASPGRAHSGGVTLPDAVRYEVMRRTGHFVTESSEHFSEYVPWFIKRDRPDLIDRFYGNVANDSIIDNLPHGCTVEVPVLVDGNGIQPTRLGAIPPHLAALMQTNVKVQSLAVEVVLSREELSR